jgi:hypothetical protein
VGRTLGRHAPLQTAAEIVIGLFANSVQAPPSAWEP